MRDSRKKISKKDSIITWNIDGEIVKKSLNERLKEVRGQARQKSREGDVIRSSGYWKKMDGSIQASARVETKPPTAETRIAFKYVSFITPPLFKHASLSFFYPHH